MAANGRWARGLAPTAHQVDAISERETALAKWTLSAGQLLIVDEASLASTFDLDEIVSAASEAGAKVLLVGDPYQLASIDAGGMFTTLVNARPDAATLNSIQRFSERWEAEASVALRSGHDAAFLAYQAHGRIVEGNRDALLEEIYAAWSRDIAQGRDAIMLAADGATVHELNARARIDRVARGEVSGECQIAQGHAGVGDLVITRENQRRMTTSDGSWVKNGDTWLVKSIGADGKLVLTRTTTGAAVTLDAAYTATNVELGYATTLHRAQGRTVERAHCYVTPRTSRELLYVAMTRGRHVNLAYVDTAYDVDPATSHDGLAETQTLEEVFASILRNVGSTRSATDVIRASYDLADSVATLLGEYTTIAQLADTTDWETLITTTLSEPTLVEGLIAATGYDALVSTMRRAHGRGVDLATTLPRLVAVRELGSATDPATVLEYRLTRWLDASRSLRPEEFIAGLFPVITGDFTDDVVTALDERRRALEARCELAIELAFETGETWVSELGPVPEGEAALAWRDFAVTVAAYRERWGIDDPYVALGTSPTTNAAQRTHRARAHAALAALAPTNRRSGTQGSPTTLHWESLSDPASWSLATLEGQLNLAREAYQRAEASLGVAVLIEDIELQTLRDEAIAAEDAVTARRSALDATLGHDVLEGATLSRDVAVVRSRIAWSDAVLADLTRSEDPQVFARRRIEVEMRELRTLINAATPESARVRGVNRDAVSEERAQLQYSLAALSADYELITGAVDDSLELAHVLEVVDARHRVDTEWLARTYGSSSLRSAPGAGEHV
jgi:hypothetical protein